MNDQSCLKDDTGPPPILGHISRLMSIPAELRLQIYSHLLSRERHRFTFFIEPGIPVSASGRHSNYCALMPTMRTCKLFHTEVEDLLYSDVAFTMLAQNQGDGTNILEKGGSDIRHFDFLRVAQNVRMMAGVSDSTSPASMLELMSGMLNTLARNGKVKVFEFELICRTESMKGWESLIGDGSGRLSVLGLKAGWFKTRKVRVAKETVEKLMKVSVELKS